MGADRHVALREHFPCLFSGEGDVFLYLATQGRTDVNEFWSIAILFDCAVPEHVQVLAHGPPHGCVIRSGGPEGVPLYFPIVIPDVW